MTTRDRILNRIFLYTTAYKSHHTTTVGEYVRLQSHACIFCRITEMAKPLCSLHALQEWAVSREHIPHGLEKLCSAFRHVCLEQR